MARRAAVLLVSLAGLTAARAAAAPASPALNVNAVQIVDATYHDVLRVVPLGRTLDVHVSLVNATSEQATNVRARLASPALNLSVGTTDEGALDAGSTGERTFVVTPATCPPHAPYVSLLISSSLGETRSGFFLPVSCVEGVLAAWLAHTGPASKASTFGSFALVLLGLTLRFSARRQVLPQLRRLRSALVQRAGSWRMR